MRQVLRARRLAGVAGAVLALTLLCSSASLAGSRTTEPGKTLVVYFIIEDQRISDLIFREKVNNTGGIDQTPEPYFVRGNVANFVVVNRGKKPHSFAFLGKKIARVKPGGKVRFARRALLVRGSFPYSSTTARGKALKGVLTVR
jgi:hypothetical protein